MRASENETLPAEYFVLRKRRFSRSESSAPFTACSMLLLYSVECTVLHVVVVLCLAVLYMEKKMNGAGCHCCFVSKLAVYWQVLTELNHHFHKNYPAGRDTCV